MFGGEIVLAGDRVLGRVTSGGYGYTVGRNILCAYVAADEPAHADVRGRSDGRALSRRAPHATAVRSRPQRDSRLSATIELACPDADASPLGPRSRRRSSTTRRDGHGMPRAFYHDDALYAAEMATIWHGGWLFAGFAFEIPNPGDFLTLTVDAIAGAGDPRRRRRACARSTTSAAIAARSSAAPTPATCARIVCPYHSWTYSRQGELVACHGMHDGVDKSQLGLAAAARAKCARASIYVSLAAAPPAFDGLRERVRSGRRAAGLRSRADRARDRLRGRGELEARLGEQPRVLSTARRAIRNTSKSNFDVYEEEHASEAVRQKIAAAIARIAIEVGRAQGDRRRAPARAASRRFPTPTTTSGTRATAPRSPRASTPSRWTASASRR